MIDFLKYKMGPIGLDIGHDSIKMIQLASGTDRFSVIAAAKFRLEPAADETAAKASLSAAIKQMYSKGGFKGKSVVCCLSNDELKVKSVRTDACDENKLQETFNSEIAPRFGLNCETHAMRYMVAGRVQQGDEIKNELLVFAVDNQIIKKHIEIVETAGLIPVGIDTVPCALFRSFERTLRRQEDRDSVKVYVDIGCNYTTVVVGRGSEISFVKQIPIGSSRFNMEIASKLGIDAGAASVLRNKLSARASDIDEATSESITIAMNPIIEQLCREIALCFKYYSVMFRGSKPLNAIFSGGQAYEAGLMESLEKQLGVEVEIAEPLRGFDCTAAAIAEGVGCEWAVAVGLSLKNWTLEEVQAGAYERN